MYVFYKGIAAKLSEFIIEVYFIFYYNNYEKGDVIEVEQNSNYGMQTFHYVAEDLIRRRIHELLEKLKKILKNKNTCAYNMNI